MARDVGGYQCGLTLFRQDMVDAWVAWFADVVAEAADRSAQVLTAALKPLEARGILIEVAQQPKGRGRPPRWWVALSLLDLLGG
jgi:predicted ArsR family transcriptional regulator